jgi:hypothetical protein
MVRKPSLQGVNRETSVEYLARIHTLNGRCRASRRSTRGWQYPLHVGPGEQGCLAIAEQLFGQCWVFGLNSTPHLVVRHLLEPRLHIVVMRCSSGAVNLNTYFYKMSWKNIYGLLSSRCPLNSCYTLQSPANKLAIARPLHMIS